MSQVCRWRGVALIVATAACAAAPRPITLETATGVQLELLLTGQTRAAPVTVVGRRFGVNLSWAVQNPESCGIAGEATATLNGQPLPLGWPGSARFENGTFAACKPASFDWPDDTALPPADATADVVVVQAGTKSWIIAVPGLLSEQAFDVLDPDEGVLTSGTQAQLRWHPPTIVNADNAFLTVALINGWDDALGRATAPAPAVLSKDLTFDSNSIRFAVPSLVSGKGFVLVQGAIRPKISRCEGLDGCAALLNLGAGVPSQVDVHGH
jgi:hypothetical protein